MLRFRLELRACALMRVVGYGLPWLLCLSSGAFPSVAMARVHKADTKSVVPVSYSPAIPKADPEVLLAAIYKDLNASQLREAEAKVDQLLLEYPNFRLGHLIRADLLLMHTHEVATFGAVTGVDERLKNLRDEAIVRLRSLQQRPDPDLVPRPVLQLRDDQKHVLIVDAKKSRLYVYENKGGQLKFITDFYVSQGKLGVNKLKAGDQKTPLGVYYITTRVAGARLPDFYGTGALPLNYPNEWDRLNGRSGSGIWLHGTPSDTYSRPPLSSDGCVVLTNLDLNRLSQYVDVDNTPVVISEQVDFVNKTKWHNDRKIAAQLVENWRLDTESMDSKRVMGNYAGQFRSERGESFPIWYGKQPQYSGSGKSLSIKLRDMTYFLYPGQEDMILATFTEDVLYGRSRSSLRKRQYWAKNGAQWKIVSESSF
jgi:murein L,D-transpeptidase YafK